MLSKQRKLQNAKQSAVSIIMPAHDSEKYIGEAIESVLCQTFQDWELIVINDGSTDRTEEIINRYRARDGRIKYIKYAETKGTWRARVEGIKRSEGRYIAFLDSDDVWIENKLERQIEFMRKECVDFSSTSYKKIDEFGNDLGKVFVPPKVADYRRVLLDCPIGNSTVVYDAIKLGREYGPDVKRREDYAFWLSLLKKTEYVYGIPLVLVEYRLHKGSYSSRKVGLIAAHWTLYRKFEHLSIGKSILHVMWWCIIKLFHLK